MLEDPLRALDDEALTGGELASTGLLGFYDRLRERVVATVERRGGRLGGRIGSYLLLVPDIFMLLARLTLDREVPRATRRLLGGALLYFVVPFDLLPEALAGVAGYVDDLVLASAVLTEALRPELHERARRHWSGDEDVFVVLSDVVLSARALLGGGLYERVRASLERRGVRVPDEP